MLHLTIFLIAFSFGTFVHGEVVSVQSQSAAALANSEFALDLLKKLSTGGKNVFFSPMSISAAVGMTSLGARGMTLSEIDQAFHFNEVKNTTNDPMVVHEVFKNIITRYQEHNSNYSLSIANRLYGQEGFEIKAQFLRDTEEYYKASLQQLNFGNGEAEGIINSWVANQTNDKIKELFKPNSLSADTVLALVNAIYFKGNWESKFDKTDTQEADFHVSTNEVKKVQMMSQTKKFPYYEDPDLNVQVLEMPYSGNDLSMIVILPQQGQLQQLISQLDAAKLSELISNLRIRKVNVKFPKFKLETEYALKETLQQLGINDLFSNRATLTGIGENLTVSKVVHKAFVEVDEEGTEAAAATGIIQVVPASLPFPPPLDIFFTADHPFFFILNDKRENALNLFLGTVTQP